MGNRNAQLLRAEQLIHLGTRWRFIALLSACWLCGPLDAWAESSFPTSRASSATEQQIQEEALYLKEETVSIASRYEQPISRAPSNVYVITDEDIRHSGATDIPTLLRQVPGMEVMQTNAVDFNVSVRGNNQLRANKLQVLIDGRSIYIDQVGVVLWKMLPVSLTEIKRIEVLKGPASAVYGFNAFDGVVNIITKSPEEMKGTTLQVAGGEVGTMLTSAVQAGTVGNWGYRLSGGHEQTQRWSDRDRQALNAQRIGGVAEYHFSGAGKIRAEAGLTTSNPYVGTTHDTSTSELYASQAYGAATYERSGLWIRGWWFGNFSESDSRIFPLLAPFWGQIGQLGRTDKESYNSYDVEARYQLKPFTILRLNIGANFRRIIDSSTFLTTRTTENRLGFYTLGDWLVLPSLEVSTGLRYDVDSFISPTLSPRGAVMYHLNSNHAFRLSGSLAYRPPTTFEVGFSILTPLTLPGLPPVNVLSFGSSDVKPERITSYELGYQGWWWNHRLRTRITGFFNHISDLITIRNTTDIPSDASRPLNGGVADVYGGEVGLEVLLTSWLSGFANYAYQEISQTSGGFSRRGFPHHKVNTGLRVTWSSFTGEVLYHHVGVASYPLGDTFTSLVPFFQTGTVLPSEHVPSYNLLNIRLGYLIWRQQASDYAREAEVAVSVFNALNDRHREHPLGDLLGTRVLGWLTMKL